jgi:hypothetical protein
MAEFKHYLVSFDESDSQEMGFARFQKTRKSKKQRRRFLRKNQSIAQDNVRKFSSRLLSKIEEN